MAEEAGPHAHVGEHVAYLVPHEDLLRLGVRPLLAQSAYCIYASVDRDQEVDSDLSQLGYAKWS